MCVKRLIAFAVIIISAATVLSQQNSIRNSVQSVSAHTALSQTTTDKASQVDTLMAHWSQGDAPGAAVIVIQDGKVVHEKGYGLADLKMKERITPQTVFDIGSITKQFTAMAVMMLAERGKLSYADTLSKFFPEFQTEARQITVRQLLNHTSGIRDYSLVWGESKKLNGNEPRTNENAVKFLARQKQLRFLPGQKWEYSNSNYILLAQIVSKVSGEPFPQFVRKNIFQPLGMNDSYIYDQTQPTTGKHATGYVSQGSGFKPAERNSENYNYGDGQINSTIGDLAKWDQSLYTETLIKAATLKEAFAAGQLNDGTPVNYGLGWGLGCYRGLRFVSHGGGTDGFAAQITRFTQQHFTVVVLSNYEQITLLSAVANKIADIYLADDLKSPAAVQIAPERLNAYVGRYALYDVVMKISLEEGALWLSPPGQKKVKLVPASEEEFFVEGNLSAASFGFNKNAQGQITCLILLDQNGTIFPRL
mgnify:CR=1 FL=1